MAEYRRAIELAPEFDVAHHALGMLAGRAGKTDEGLYHLATAFRLRGDYSAALSHYSRLEPLLREGDPRTAEVQGMVEELRQFLDG